MYLCQPAADRAALLREQLAAQSLLAAALWLAIKFEALRTSTPDAGLMYSLTGIGGLRGKGAVLGAGWVWQVSGREWAGGLCSGLVGVKPGAEARCPLCPPPPNGPVALPALCSPARCCSLLLLDWHTTHQHHPFTHLAPQAFLPAC